MAPISPCQSGRRVITDDRTVRLSSMLSCVYVCVYAFFVCVLYPVRMSGHCGRCGYSSISTISLRSIASLPLLSPHHSVTPPPSRLSPGSAKSDDERLVPRLPAGIPGYCDGVTQPIQASGRIKPLKWRQSSSQVLC